MIFLFCMKNYLIKGLFNIGLCKALVCINACVFIPNNIQIKYLKNINQLIES